MSFSGAGPGWFGASTQTFSPVAEGGLWKEPQTVAPVLPPTWPLFARPSRSSCTGWPRMWIKLGAQNGSGCKAGSSWSTLHKDHPIPSEPQRTSPARFTDLRETARTANSQFSRLEETGNCRKSCWRVPATSSRLVLCCCSPPTAHKESKLTSAIINS